MEDNLNAYRVIEYKESPGQQALDDYKLACISRYTSTQGRSEVLGKGRAKFGIFGDGKELPQITLARALRPGDFHSGYYRDQTLMLGTGLATPGGLFSQLYADVHDPFSGGRQMNSHFSSLLVDGDGNIKDHLDQINRTADISPTGGQMARALGVAVASRDYRKDKGLRDYAEKNRLSDKGNEVGVVTIGNASTDEGVFFETMNAAGVMQVPLVGVVYDDEYGISVSSEDHTVKESISKAMAGFQTEHENDTGIDIYTVKAWDYEELCAVQKKAIEITRETHRPCLIHVKECTQPQGHSTSGSHERYKDDKRMKFEEEYDCNTRMRSWMIEEGHATEEELQEIERESKEIVQKEKEQAWKKYQEPIQEKLSTAVNLLDAITAGEKQATVDASAKELKSIKSPIYKDIADTVRRVLFELVEEDASVTKELKAFNEELMGELKERFTKHLYSETDKSPLLVKAIDPIYSDTSPEIPGYEILQAYFDYLLENNPGVSIFGEDVGKIGDVNQGVAGLQKKYGELRVGDRGIRERTIIGEAIGKALRGLRPIAEIQYLDYILYALSPLSDDLATVRRRSNGQQAAPAIIRTRGHRLEGVWHSGSPMGMLLNSLKGMHVCVPRNMVQAAGMYNTLLQGDDPALVIERLNGYREKEKLPDNMGEFTVPLGIPEVMREGEHVTLVTYGACVSIAKEAAKLLADKGIDIEVIDVQTLMPFDIHGKIGESLKKTSRIVFVDEDVEGGASAYMMQQVFERQDGYNLVDSQPTTITGTDNRPPYGDDGNYHCKPNTMDIVEKIYGMMHEFDPNGYPKI